MKKNKAFLEFEGRPLIERSLSVLQTVFAEVLISCNKPGLYEGYEVPVILDEILDRGPLEGLYQGLKAANYDNVFFVACDMPFLDTELIHLLAKWVPECDIVIPQLKDNLHPLHAFYNRRCLPVIKEFLDSGCYKVKDLVKACSVRYVSERELQNFPNLSKILSNVNTLEEWSALVRE
jgi:molybdopterin-guanine dinucleotide biosynthesis protein A